MDTWPHGIVTPEVLYQAAYRYVQRHGTIQFSDDKHMQITGDINPFNVGDARLQCECTISVEPREGGGSYLNVVDKVYGPRKSGFGGWGYPQGAVVNGIRATLEKAKNVPGDAVPSTSNAAVTRPTVAAQTSITLATVTVKSDPDGADIAVDGKFVGSTPSTLQLVPGDHSVDLKKSGYKAWQRTMGVIAGGNITVNAALEKNP